MCCDDKFCGISVDLGVELRMQGMWMGPTGRFLVAGRAHENKYHFKSLIRIRIPKRNFALKLHNGLWARRKGPTQAESDMELDLDAVTHHLRDIALALKGTMLRLILGDNG
jgi:hypothetical protein